MSQKGYEKIGSSFFLNDPNITHSINNHKDKCPILITQLILTDIVNVITITFPHISTHNMIMCRGKTHVKGLHIKHDWHRNVYFIL